ncbi:hypothetical protein HJFPF1_05385 [Paramyrothecium foliicola]|nr:hypothetical protein HJFPF1_05385 [Paramyrothecium foliicola]
MNYCDGASRRRMMATEPTVNSSADVSALPEAQAVDDDAQPVQSGQHIVNGTTPAEDLESIANKHITNVEDQLNSADVSVSGGSDTEASRGDGTRQKDGDKGHGRTSSAAKKPATFKAVSVNKTFLAAKANAGSASSKLSDKPLPGSSTPPTGSASLAGSRPRLVVKATSGASNAVPRYSAAANGGRPAAAADGGVWNKNRPTPPPEPKKLTDEELKKYGIHMASRLNEDEASGQNKWADIDDDDDDWAPEAITWGDGTKTTLPHPDEHPIPAAIPPAIIAQAPQASMPAPPKEKIPEKPKSPAPPTVTASPVTKSSGLASGKGLVLKSSSQEKPTLVSKVQSPQPGPAKSPWATLPPVEKAPLAPNDTHPALRGLSRDSMPPRAANLPLKEIAADDFSRASLRDGAPPGNKELYNSQSGRYEPAPDRRGSMRLDAQPKHPALLQRPNASDHPAEPSSAFQTNRTGPDAPFGRRRGSSNVSGGSGSYYQRAGKPFDASMPPAEVLGARRVSLSGSSASPVLTEAQPVSLQNHSRPQPGSGMIPRSSPGAAFATPHQQGGSADMTMPPPPIPAHSVEEDLEYQKKLMRERVELARKRRQDEEAREEAERRERIQKKLEAMGPAPVKKSEKKDSPPKDDIAKPTRIESREPNQAVTAPVSTIQPKQDAATQEAAATETDANKAMSPNSNVTAQTSTRRASQDAESKQPDLWGGSGPRPDRLGPWASAALPPPSRNVWGSPDKDRALGNGTFNPDLSLIGGSPVGHPPAANGPPPIAPPSGARVPSHGRSQPQPPIGSRASRYGAPGSDLATKWVAAVADSDKKISATMLAERAEQERHLAERGMNMEDAQPIIKDTWRPVQISGDGTRRPIASMEVQSHHGGPWRTSRDDLANSPPRHDAVGPATNAGVIGSGSSSILKQSSQGGPSQSRASRFFPTRESRVDYPTAVELERPNSPSPPPPTMEGHPAYEGDVMHPHVSLPKPHPVVKLPPVAVVSLPTQTRPTNAWASAAAQRDVHRHVSGPAHPAPPLALTQPSARTGERTQENWQNRINNLLNGGKGSPPKSMGVDPASKSALDHHLHHDSATVSLPVAARTFETTTQKASVTKPMAEECFEEQEMGSLPQIRLPHKAPEALWEPVEFPAKPLPRKFHIHPSNKESYHFSMDVFGGGNGLKIRFPNMNEPKVVTVPFSATRGGRGSQSTRGSRGRGSGHGSRGGKREASASHGERSVSSSGRGSRGIYRGRGSENWNRHAPTQSSTPA